MSITGRCHCGDIRYEVAGDPLHHALCHCMDCRRSAGAPTVAWALFAEDAVSIAGQPRIHASSENGRRHFCPRCGAGLFYTNAAVFPGMIDVQSATLDDPDAFPLQAQIQTAERIGWMAHAHELPQFERYPPEE